MKLTVKVYRQLNAVRVWLLGKGPYIPRRVELSRICCCIILVDGESIYYENKQLADVGRLLNLAGEELHTFTRTEQALARDERIRVREEKKEDDEKMAAEAEKIRQQKKEDDEKMAAEVEKIRQQRKEDDKTMAAEAEKLRIHKLEDEERIRQHKK